MVLLDRALEQDRQAGHPPDSPQHSLRRLMRASSSARSCSLASVCQTRQDAAAQPVPVYPHGPCCRKLRPPGHQSVPTAVQVEKQCAKFYTMHVDQDTIDRGFIIAAHSPALSKFKLLLFEQAPDGHQWELVRQVTTINESHSCAPPQLFPVLQLLRHGVHKVASTTCRRTARRCAGSQQPRSSSCSCPQRRSALHPRPWRRAETWSRQGRNAHSTDRRPRKAAPRHVPGGVV
jgi:hypothetical protein